MAGHPPRRDGVGAGFGVCTRLQIDERTAVRVNVERGTATTVEPAIPVGGCADDAFGSVTGYRIEDGWKR